jgi:hypothetical protein
VAWAHRPENYSQEKQFSRSGTHGIVPYDSGGVMVPCTFLDFECIVGNTEVIRLFPYCRSSAQNPEPEISMSAAFAERLGET